MTITHDAIGMCETTVMHGKDVMNEVGAARRVAKVPNVDVVLEVGVGREPNRLRGERICCTVGAGDPSREPFERTDFRICRLVGRQSQFGRLVNSSDSDGSHAGPTTRDSDFGRSRIGWWGRFDIERARTRTTSRRLRTVPSTEMTDRRHSASELSDGCEE
ncbi:unnamed protein product [Phytophthora fragariaefolia]|uniref:Unnamed protein product n=1 Tax=Phytophthora fragariaefolia TaxID=1490495 RepID=A0A9W6YIJ2_9STRA|nr:unnamed protein product [Phytophthora fragariaefolia]